MPDKLERSGRTVLFIVIPVVIITIPVVYSILSPLFVKEAQAFYESPDPKYTKCVKDTEYMRFHHWELLRGIREEVVRYGERGDIGLRKCAECHTSRERFCNRCHEAASLYPDCFGCHYYP